MERVWYAPGKKGKKGVCLYIRSMGLIFIKIQMIGSIVAGRPLSGSEPNWGSVQLLNVSQAESRSNSVLTWQQSCQWSHLRGCGLLLSQRKAFPPTRGCFSISVICKEFSRNLWFLSGSWKMSSLDMGYGIRDWSFAARVIFRQLEINI